MIQGEPKWWKVLLKEPGYWLIGLTVIAMLGTAIVGSILDLTKNDEQKVEKVNEAKNNKAQ